MQRDAGAYLRYVRETNPELTVTLKMHLHDTAATVGGGSNGVNGEWKRAKKVRINLVHSICGPRDDVIIVFVRNYLC